MASKYKWIVWHRPRKSISSTSPIKKTSPKKYRVKKDNLAWWQGWFDARSSVYSSARSTYRKKIGRGKFGSSYRDGFRSKENDMYSDH